MAEQVLLILLGLEVKHYLGDYILQFEWMLRDKRSFARPGGYVHAGVHALGSLLVFLAFSLPQGLIALLIAVEFVVHLLLDFTKAHLDVDMSRGERPRAFWALNGLDQFFHHATYLGLAYAVVKMT